MKTLVAEALDLKKRLSITGDYAENKTATNIIGKIT